ncbi:hypothetical protein OUZ56_021338 [Daphnia magna]|uniref:Secreted protein n=1 Tax=Daphnia magna TaxID=35525 RepID=A0ABQ9ZH28_9CRUS|nr:hypothetical protein OUZ56_021338 [Daphnia magna]
MFYRVKCGVQLCEVLFLLYVDQLMAWSIGVGRLVSPSRQSSFGRQPAGSPKKVLCFLLVSLRERVLYVWLNERRNIGSIRVFGTGVDRGHHHIGFLFPRQTRAQSVSPRAVLSNSTTYEAVANKSIHSPLDPV